MFEDAATVVFLGRTVYLYGVFVAVGLLAGGMTLLLRIRGQRQLLDGALMALVLSPLLGIVGARLLYAVADSTFRQVLTIRNLVSVSTGGFSMFGALAGACLGTYLAARITGSNPKGLLDLAAPSMLLFIGFARFGEGYTAIGTGRPVVSDVIRHTILTVPDAYGDYLRTYAIEGAIAFVLFGIIVWQSTKARTPGDVFLLSALLYGITQTLMESLRSDRHLTFGFVKLQHVLSAVLFGGVLVYLAIRWIRQGGPKALPIAAITSLPVLVGLVVALEFAIDRTDWNKLVCYLVYIALLCWPLYAGIRLLDGKGVHR